MSVSPRSTPVESARSQSRERRSRDWFAGGPDGNEQLTAATGVVLLVLLAALGVTIVFIGRFLAEHLFLGLLLLGPVALKMASSGYRFARYYTHDREYVRRGAPEIWLRLLGPAVVVTTIGVFASGVWLLIVGPADRDPALLIHKVTFFAWLAATGLHVLGHLAQMPRALRGDDLDGARFGQRGNGGAGRTLALVGAVVAGLVLAVALIPEFSTWTAHTALLHHHHRH